MEIIFEKYKVFILLIVVLFLLVGIGKFMSNREN